MDERFGWVLLGAAIGFVMGYIVARLREIDDKLDTVDEHVLDHQRNEDGFISTPRRANIFLAIALSILVLGVWFSQMAAQDARDAVRDVRRYSDLQTNAIVCNAEYLNAQAAFLRVYLEQPPATQPEQREAIQDFVVLLDAYGANDGTELLDSPYSNRDELRSCVEAENTEKLRGINE